MLSRSPGIPRARMPSPVRNGSSPAASVGSVESSSTSGGVLVTSVAFVPSALLTLRGRCGQPRSPVLCALCVAPVPFVLSSFLSLAVCCGQHLSCASRVPLPLSIKGRGNLTHEVCDLGIARPATSSERKQRCRARAHLQQFEQFTLGTSGVVEHADGCERTELQLVRCAPHNRKIRVKSWGHSRDNALFDRSVSKVIHRQAPTAPTVERSTRTAVLRPDR